MLRGRVDRAGRSPQSKSNRLWIDAIQVMVAASSALPGRVATIGTTAAGTANALLPGDKSKPLKVITAACLARAALHLAVDVGGSCQIEN
jgi:hypothetical protein